MKRTITILCLSSLILCFYISSTYAFTAPITKKDATVSTPEISQDAAEDNTVDMELNDEEQIDESLQVKATTDKVNAVKDAKTEVVEDIHEEGAKNLR